MVSSSNVKETSKEWDLFICHASEDKDEVVRPLVNALIAVGFSVWYDEFTLTLGDNLRRSIDKGLAQSKYGLVIFSQDFFKKNWPQTELDGLVAKERDGKKVILPVWHKINREYVLKFSPTLADRYAVSTDQGIDRVVKEVLKAVRPSLKQKPRQEEESAIGRLDQVIDFLRSKNLRSIKKIVKEMKFENLNQMFSDALDAIAFFDLSESQTNLSVFNFIYIAIIERKRKEGAELFKKLLTWYFQTVTPSCKEIMLEIFARLTRLSYLKEVVASAKLTNSFVTEFGISYSYDIAGINADILKNIQFLLSETDCDRIVEYALSNDQILHSLSARDYLLKVLGSCEGKTNKKRLDVLRRRLTQM